MADWLVLVLSSVMGFRMRLVVGVKYSLRLVGGLLNVVYVMVFMSHERWLFVNTGFWWQS